MGVIASLIFNWNFNIEKMGNISVDLWGTLFFCSAFQGFFIAVILFLNKKGNIQANRVFSVLLFLFSFYLLEIALAVTGFIEFFPHLIFTTFPVVYAIAPLFYFYSKSLIDPNFKITYKKLLHFTPACLIFLLLFPFYSKGADYKLAFLTDFYQLKPDLTLKDTVITIVYFIYNLIYMNLCYRMLIAFKIEARSKTLSWLDIRTSFLENIIYSYLMFLVLGVVFFFVFKIFPEYQLFMNYFMLCVMAFMIFSVGYSALNQPSIFSNFKQTSSEVKYERSSLTNVMSQKTLHKLIKYMIDEKPYLYDDINIKDFSKKLNTSKHHLSQVINQQLKTTFQDFINEYRINEAQKLLSDPNNSHLKIMDIAVDVGFNNKSTFNRVFKKYTGLTPSEFRESDQSDLVS